jgi:hypothetical protein
MLDKLLLRLNSLHFFLLLLSLIESVRLFIFFIGLVSLGIAGEWLVDDFYLYLFWSIWHTRGRLSLLLFNRNTLLSSNLTMRLSVLFDLMFFSLSRFGLSLTLLQSKPIIDQSWVYKLK